MIQKKKEIVSLSKEGQTYVEKGLPERRLIKALNLLGGEATIDNTAKRAKLQKALLPIALGWLRRKKWVSIPRKGILIVSGEANEGDDEKTLGLLAKKGSIVIKDLEDDNRRVVEVLRKRKLVDVKEEKSRLSHELKETENQIKRLEDLLSGPFSQKAPEEVVSKEKEKLAEYRETASTLTDQINNLNLSD